MQFSKGQQFTVKNRAGEEVVAFVQRFSKKSGKVVLMGEDNVRYRRLPSELVDNPEAFDFQSPVDGLKKTAAIQEALGEFDINKRFSILESYTDMVIRGSRLAMVVTGRGGTGKTYAIMSRIKNEINQRFLDRKLTNEDTGETVTQGTVKVVKGYTTAKGLYNTLYHNREGLVIFDDCDEALKNATSLNILKSALDTYDTRIVSWNAQLPPESEVPQEFEFTGRIIFISNIKKDKLLANDHTRAILTRCTVVDVDMTTSELIDRIENQIQHVRPEISSAEKIECLEIMKEYTTMTDDMSFRTFLEVLDYQQDFVNFPEQWEGRNLSWQEFARYAILNSNR